MKINTPSDLKYAVEQSGTSPHFFTRQTMRNYGLRKPAKLETQNGPVTAYELTRKSPVKCGQQSSAFFHAETLQRVFPI
jgi:hypothetical protein